MLALVPASQSHMSYSSILKKPFYAHMIHTNISAYVVDIQINLWYQICIQNSLCVNFYNNILGFNFIYIIWKTENTYIIIEIYLWQDSRKKREYKNIFIVFNFIADKQIVVGPQDYYKFPKYKENNNV